MPCKVGCVPPPLPKWANSRSWCRLLALLCCFWLLGLSGLKFPCFVSPLYLMARSGCLLFQLLLSFASEAAEHISLDVPNFSVGF